MYARRAYGSMPCCGIPRDRAALLFATCCVLPSAFAASHQGPPVRRIHAILTHERAGVLIRSLERWRQGLRIALAGVISLNALGLTVYSAILTKEACRNPPPAVVQTIPIPEPPIPQAGLASPSADPAPPTALPFTTADPQDAAPNSKVLPAGTRFFDGRPIRAVRTLRMIVTAYSPDYRSCGPSADGRTATLHHVSTNGGKLIAADPRVLPYGSLVNIPGYRDGDVVPVLDCGSRIKGRRLDVLFPSHAEARHWGVKTISVAVWEYADGKPPGNPRRQR